MKSDIINISNKRMDMAKIEKGSITHLFLEIITVSVAGIILWPLLDLLYHQFITNSPFNYSVFEHVVEPIIFGCIFGLLSWVINKRK